MSDACAGIGGSRGKHTGPSGRRARREERRCKHPVLSAGKSISSSFPSCSSACRHKVGDMPGRMRRGLLPCVKVSSYYWKPLLMTMFFWKWAMVFFEVNTIYATTWYHYCFLPAVLWLNFLEWSVLLYCAYILWKRCHIIRGFALMSWENPQVKLAKCTKLVFMGKCWPIQSQLFLRVGFMN